MARSGRMSTRWRNGLEKTREISLRRDVEVAQAAGVVALGNVVSRVLGLVREMVKSGLFGAGPHVDALNAAIRVPSVLYDLLVGGMVSSALIPVLSDYVIPERRAELWRLLSVLISIASLALCALVLLGELLAPQIVRLLVEGLSPSYQALAADLLRLALPAVIFLSLSSVLSGGLYALKRFTFPAFTAAIFNAGVVVVALALGRRWGVRSMAAGLLVGSALQVAFQLPGLRGARVRFTLDFRHPALRRIGSLYLPILIGLAVDTLAVLLSYNLASRIGEGSISWMEYAATIIQFPLGLVVTAVSIAILPTLSQYAEAEETGPFQTILAQGLRLVLALIIPATVGLYVLANPVIALSFEHGDFTPADTVATAAALRCALLGLLFAAIDQPLIFAFYARKDTLTPALVGVGTTFLYVAMALVPWRMGALTLPLLVLVNSLKLAAHALAMLALTRRRLGGLGDHGLWPLVLKAALASLAMAALTGGVMRFLAASAPPGLVGELLVVGGAGGVGVVVYGLLALALRIKEIHLLRAVVGDGLNRLTGAGR
ncbi:MAG: murein biosynthesis integral membrane protein MurJ [Anaerolineaceae bacterium 4572_32.2]|nr:MAG: murein biosynthesis integral membrane protein MurJ [Anaerolineaceae bacterium 4572_32.2]